MGISAIEIDLSSLEEADIKDWKNFWEYISNPENMQWLYNAKAQTEITKLEKQLLKKIQKIEKEYLEEERALERKIKAEKTELKRAIPEIEKLIEKNNLKKLTDQAQKHPSWQYTKKYVPFSWENIPDFLNVDTPSGDWIYGCDRRVWQTNFYSYYVLKRGTGTKFSTRTVDEWLQNTVECKVPDCAKIGMIYKNKYPDIVPESVEKALVSSWRTLNTILYHLCDIGILNCIGADRGKRGSYWYETTSHNSETEC